MKIAGRAAEIALLQGLLHRENAEFVAVYGRRRVGKTYLVRQVYAQQIVFDLFDHAHGFWRKTERAFFERGH